MNTLSINNPQPSFKGVRITPDVTLGERPFEKVVFSFVPNYILKGIQMGGTRVKSETVEQLTELLVDTISFHQPGQHSLVTRSMKDPSKFSFIRLRKFINKIINELGLEHYDKDDLFKFLKKTKMTVQKPRGQDTVEVVFSSENKTNPFSIKNIKAL